MSYSSASQRYLVKIIGQQFGLSPYKVEEFLGDESTYSTIEGFLKGDERVPKLLFYYQTRDTFTEDGEFIEAPGASARRLACCCKYTSSCAAALSALTALCAATQTRRHRKSS